ncbi:hypothetical protein V490_09315 [Pseudogymnoascus sp. VKM F-3557]|nr:hypothetical protein V490_09315 [Pseudogymnoascus sp. VKM F-3557]
MPSNEPQAKPETPAANSSPAQTASRSREMMCTHITMVRMYSDNMRCSLCLNPGSFGWLYRCSQDRELMIENAYNEGGVNVLDNLFDDYAIPTEPKRRSAAARARPVSFLEEMASGQLQSYSTQQLSTLLDQRTHVLDVAKRHSRDLDLYRHNEKSILNPFSILGGDISNATKLWVPNPQDECQFKVCHRCRHTRSTTTDLINITQTSKSPKTVSNEKGLGISVAKASPDRLSEQASTPPSPFDDEAGADTTFGQSSNAYDSSAMARSLNLESNTEIIPIDPANRLAFRQVLSINQMLAAETAKADAVEEHTLLSHIRAADTPPNSPRLRAAALDDRRGKAFPGGRSDNSLHTNSELRRKFNLDDVEGGELDEDITHILRKRRFYLATDAASDSESESDGKSTLEFATAVEVEDRDTRQSITQQLGADNKVSGTKETLVMQLSDVITQL